MSIVLIIVATLAAPILAIVFAEWWTRRRRRRKQAQAQARAATASDDSRVSQLLRMTPEERQKWLSGSLADEEKKP